ncbi:transposase [Planosporangium flavigriseum]|nr:transposase [Planosporangium flavigriseum]
MRDRGSWLKRDGGSIRSSARARCGSCARPASRSRRSRDLGINDGTLANWVKKDREQRGEAAAGQLSEDERAELARLRRENRASTSSCVSMTGRFPTAPSRRSWPSSG